MDKVVSIHSPFFFLRNIPVEWSKIGQTNDVPSILISSPNSFFCYEYVFFHFTSIFFIFSSEWATLPQITSIRTISNFVTIALNSNLPYLVPGYLRFSLVVFCSGLQSLQFCFIFSIIAKYSRRFRLIFLQGASKWSYVVAHNK